MKKAKFFKVKCLLVALIMVALCATTAFAAPYEFAENVSGHIDHPGSENCIYSCVLDTLEAPAVPGEAAFVAPYVSPEVVDEQIYAIHADCIYSCEHTPSLSEQLYGNSDSKEIPLISKADSQNLLTEFSPIENPSEEEQIEFFAEFFGVAVEAIDLDWIFAPVTPPSDEEVENFIAELEKNFPEFFENLENFAVNPTDDIRIQPSSASCNHYYLTHDCGGKHTSSVGSCQVFCQRILSCYYKCGFESTTLVTETVHSWSAGWCGQTCTSCGKIEMFHAPGGCFYCK